MTRFAFESGLKCLYTNSPGNASLVASHREGGENYEKTRGASSALLQTSDPSKAAGFFPLPGYAFLASWQLDFNLRRAGNIGQSQLSAKKAEGSSTFFSDWIRSKNSEKFRSLISEPLLIAGKELLEANLVSSSSVLHLGITPFFLFLPEK